MGRGRGRDDEAVDTAGQECVDVRGLLDAQLTGDTLRGAAHRVGQHDRLDERQVSQGLRVEGPDTAYSGNSDTHGRVSFGRAHDGDRRTSSSGGNSLPRPSGDVNDLS